MKRYIVSCLCLLFLVLLLGGCGHGRSNILAPDIKNNNELSKKIEASVYIDGTLSMYGYVNYPGGTVYTNTLQDIERNIKTIWSKDDIKFYKFGDSILELSRDGYIASNRTEFYNGLDTNLGSVIQSTKSNKLSIIVTDLFQTNQDLDSLIGSLKSKYISEDKGIGIIGIKSQFNGKIYDIGKFSSQISYTSTKDPNSYRPFYLIVMGNASDVKAFMQGMNDKLADTQHNMIYIGKYIATMDLINSDIDQKVRKIKKATGLAELNVKNHKDYALAYRLNLKEKESMASIQAKLTNIAGILPGEYTYQINNVEYDNKSINKDFITLDGLKLTTNGAPVIDFNIFIKSGGLDERKEGTYVVYFGLQPTKNSYLKSTKLFNDWNFSDTQINTANVIYSLGNKTLNINRFIEGLGIVNYEINNPITTTGVIILQAKK